MTTRRTLTPDELTFTRICFKNIDRRYLNQTEQKMLRSFESNFEWDQKLSDKQLDALKRFKRTSDVAKRSDAIAKGRLSQDTSSVSAKLNTIYNEAGKKH